MIEEGKIHWPVPEEFPLLRDREIHLWCAWLGQPDAPAAAGDCSLSADENIRAGSFYFAPDRHRYAAARRNLRGVLAGYLGRDPATLVFSYGRFGKPQLIQPAGTMGSLDPATSHLAFNQSHCGSLWLLAVAWNQPVGIDLEELKDLPDLALVARSIFSPEELLHQQSLSLAERQLAFFRRWTLREATAKFQGLGFDPSAPLVPADQSEHFSPTDRHVGCLVHGGTSIRIRRFGWDASLGSHPGANTVNPTLGLLSLPTPAEAPVGL